MVTMICNSDDIHKKNSGKSGSRTDVCYRSEDGMVLRREVFGEQYHGERIRNRPSDRALTTFWVLRNNNGDIVDRNASRDDLLDWYDIELRDPSVAPEEEFEKTYA